MEKHLQNFILLAAWCSTALACYGTLIASGITSEEKTIILQEHNRLRQMVATGQFSGQPAATNMREIVWDDELAMRAQKWAENCQFRHDPYRTIDRFTMGQNMAIIWSTIPLEADDGDFPSRIKNWFNEVQLYSFGDPWSPKTGHYSQLVWGETHLIGCGYSEYKDEFKYNKLYVCNYGPGGNVVGEDPYVTGPPSCEQHGMQKSRRYYGLCSSEYFPSIGIFANSIEQHDYKETNLKKSLFPVQSFITRKAFKESSSSLSSSTEVTIKMLLPKSSTRSPERLPAHKNKSLISHRSQSTHEISSVVAKSKEMPTPLSPSQSGWSLLTWRG